jgi:eukaryotic-like serine/threonine-protein kinase
VFELRGGDLLAQKYRVERVIGAGGMGLVVAATHVQLRQRVAIKVLLPDMATRPNVVARFLREGRTAATIRSAHVARVFDVGLLDDGLPYLVMEHLTGATASSLLRKGGPLDVPVAVAYVLQACEALVEAHAAGIVHRDLKPSNLFVTVEPNGTASVKLLDFGISKVTGEDLTQSDSMLGSPSYMSPEQVLDAKNVDERADIWGVGVVLYELIAGSRPFTGDSVPAICRAITTAAPESLRTLVPDLPPGLDDVVLRCLRKPREERFQTIADVVEALTPFAGEARSAFASLPADPSSDVTLPAPEGSRRPLTVALLTAALVMTIGASLALASRARTRAALPVAPAATSERVEARPLPPTPPVVVAEHVDAGSPMSPTRRAVVRSPHRSATPPVKTSAPSSTALFEDRKW